MVIFFPCLLLRKPIRVQVTSNMPGGINRILGTSSCVPKLHFLVFSLLQNDLLQTLQIQSCFSFAAGSDFLQNDIRVKPDLDALGALGDVGWYCIRSILWAANFELPKTVTALRGPVLNEVGVILSCGAYLNWEDGKVATFHCSFLSNLTMNVTAIGTKGTLHLQDFVIPFEEEKASFSAGTECWFTDLVTGWVPKPSEHTILTDLPQVCVSSVCLVFFLISSCSLVILKYSV